MWSPARSTGSVASPTPSASDSCPIPSRGPGGFAIVLRGPALLIPQLRRGAASSRPSGSGPGVSPEPASVRMPPSTCLLFVSVSRSFSRRDARSSSRGTPLTASRRPSCPLAGGAALRGNIFLCLGRAALETRLPVAVVPRCPAISPHRRKKAPSAAAGA